MASSVSLAIALVGLSALALAEVEQLDDGDHAPPAPPRRAAPRGVLTL